MAKAQSRERGFFGDVVIIHDGGGSRLPRLSNKPWRFCDVSDCSEMAIDRNGEEFVCAAHSPRSAAE